MLTHVSYYNKLSCLKGWWCNTKMVSRRSICSFIIYNIWWPTSNLYRRYLLTQDVLKADHILKSNWYPARFDKFFKGTEIVADKGFAQICQLLPNNKKINFPHFLTKEAQFTKAQLLHDRGIKETRWKDEGVFSRLTDETFIAGIVPYNRINYILACANLGLMRNNLKQPFYKPKIYGKNIFNIH